MRHAVAYCAECDHVSLIRDGWRLDCTACGGAAARIPAAEFDLHDRPLFSIIDRGLAKAMLGCSRAAQLSDQLYELTRGAGSFGGIIEQMCERIPSLALGKVLLDRDPGRALSILKTCLAARSLAPSGSGAELASERLTNKLPPA
jgi:hypothetical protein